MLTYQCVDYSACIFQIWCARGTQCTSLSSSDSFPLDVVVLHVMLLLCLSLVSSCSTKFHDVVPLSADVFPHLL